MEASFADEAAASSLSEGPSPCVIESTTDHLIASWLHFLLVVWRQGTTLEAVRTMGTSLAELAGKCGHGAGLFIIAEPAAFAPGPEVRGPITTMLQAAPISVCGLTLEGSGFGRAARLAFATGVGLIARPRFPYRPFPGVTETAMWLAKPQGAGCPLISGRALERAVTTARSAEARVSGRS